jgi:AbrB family looped-hinge helix DNA binding protein
MSVPADLPDLNLGLTLACPSMSSKVQLVIPARLRQLLGLKPGDRLALKKAARPAL